MKYRQTCKLGMLLACALCFASAAGTAPQETASTGKPKKVLFLGNSITFHGAKPDIGWSGNWGMAASAEDKDFVHLVARALGENAGAASEIMIKNIAEFEREYSAYDADSKLKDAREFGADIIVFAIGENVPGLKSEEEKLLFGNGLRKLLGVLRAGQNPTIVVRSSFWPNPAKDEILKQVCQETGGIFVDIGHLAKEEANRAGSERNFEHKGVAAHPGDKGMQAIADAILGAIDKHQGKEAPERGR